MKSKYFLSILVLISAFTFMSCEDKDNQKPTVSNLEVGHNDTIFAGYPVHLEFEATDNDLLNNYRVTIHAESDHHKSSVLDAMHWEFDSTFREINGVKNYTVHHHAIHVPANALTGDYHFHLIVADRSGNTTAVEKDITLAPAEAYHGDEHGK